MSTKITKAEQARQLSGDKTGDELEPLRSGLLIAKWHSGLGTHSKDGRVYWPKSVYPTIEAASDALKAAGLPHTGLDFTQYRAKGSFTNLVEVIAQAGPAPAEVDTTDTASVAVEENDMTESTVAPAASIDAEAFASIEAEIKAEAAARLKDARKAQLQGMIDAGSTTAEIAEALDLSVARTRQILKDADLTPAKSRAANADRDETIRQLFIDGAKVEDVASQYGLSVARTRQIKSKLGLTTGGASRITWESDEQQNEAHAAVQALDDIALALGSTPSAVLRRVIREVEAAEAE